MAVRKTEQLARCCAARCWVQLGGTGRCGLGRELTSQYVDRLHQKRTTLFQMVCATTFADSPCQAMRVAEQTRKNKLRSPHLLLLHPDTRCFDRMSRRQRVSGASKECIRLLEMMPLLKSLAVQLYKRDHLCFRNISTSLHTYL